MQKEFIVHFHGKSKVMAYTKNEAESIISSGKSIKSDGCLRTESVAYWIGKGFLINLGGIMTLLTCVLMIKAWSGLLEQSQILPEPFNFIGIMVAFILIMSTLRIPKITGGWFDNVHRGL